MFFVQIRRIIDHGGRCRSVEICGVDASSDVEMTKRTLSVPTPQLPTPHWRARCKRICKNQARTSKLEVELATMSAEMGQLAGELPGLQTEAAQVRQAIDGSVIIQATATVLESPTAHPLLSASSCQGTGISRSGCVPSPRPQHQQIMNLVILCIDRVEVCIFAIS